MAAMYRRLKFHTIQVAILIATHIENSLFRIWSHLESWMREFRIRGAAEENGVEAFMFLQKFRTGFDVA